MNNQHDDLLKDTTYKDIHLFLPDELYEHLKKQDVDGNISKGTRNLIYRDMKRSRLMKLQQSLLFILVLLILILGIFQIWIL